MASTFASWFRGTPISNTAPGSTDYFAYVYRGAVGSPVVHADVATTAATASGGLASGGSAAAFVDHVVLAGGGLSFGGGQATSASVVAVDSFRHWRRGASISNTSRSSSDHFDHVRRGAVGVPVVVVRPVGQSFTAVASGGTSLGGSASPSRGSIVATTIGLRAGGSAEIGPLSLAAPATGGARFGGSSSAEVSYAASAGGGLKASGRAVGGLSTTAQASAGWSLGGRSIANLSALVASSGGATLGGSSLMLEIGYHIYINDGHGGPIDYATPLDTVYDTSWTSPVLAASSSYQFGVRAFGSSSGLEERNLDASVRLDLDAGGDDVTYVPRPPIGVRAIPLAGGRLRVEWTAVATDPRRRPTGFRVYAQPTALTDYTTPIAEAPYATDRAGTFAVEIGPLNDGVTYAISVRAWNARGEERNVNCVYVDADASPPSPIGSLQATPIARHG